MIPLHPPILAAMLGVADGVARGTWGAAPQPWYREWQNLYRFALVGIAAAGELSGNLDVDTSTTMMICGTAGLTSRAGLAMYESGHKTASGGAAVVRSTPPHPRFAGAPIDETRLVNPPNRQVAPAQQQASAGGTRLLI